MKEGAAWAAVEYMRWATEMENTSSPQVSWKGLTIVPVAIVYTDKSKYQSRVSQPRLYLIIIHTDALHSRYMSSACPPLHLRGRV